MDTQALLDLTVEKILSVDYYSELTEKQLKDVLVQYLMFEYNRIEKEVRIKIDKNYNDDYDPILKRKTLEKGIQKEFIKIINNLHKHKK